LVANGSSAQEAVGAKLRAGVVLRGVTGPKPPCARIRPNDWSQPEADPSLATGKLGNNKQVGRILLKNSSLIEA